MKRMRGIRVPGSHTHHALREMRATGRADSVHIAQALGISRNSASAALRRLRDAGMIRIVGTSSESSNGPKPFVYQPQESKKCSN